MKITVLPFRRCLRCAGLSLLAAVFAAASASERSSPLDDVIALPEFRVVSERPLPPRESWSYVQLGNFEVLSSAPDRVTREFVGNLRDFQIVLGNISRHMLIRAELPVMVILCAKPGQFQQLSGARWPQSTAARATSLVRDNELAAIVVDYGAPQFGDEITFLPSVATATGRNQQSQPLVVGRRPIQTTDEFVRQYIHLALSQMSRPLPAWAAEGIANIYSDIEYNNTWIQIGLPKSFRNEYLVESPYSSYAQMAGGRDPFAYGSYGFDNPGYQSNWMQPTAVYIAPTAIMPIERMLVMDYDSPEFRNSGAVRDAWRKQVTAFAHMCLYGRSGRYKQGFINFTSRTSGQPPTEVLFKECFGIGYKAMAFELRSYTEFTDYKSTVFQARKGENILAPKPKIQTRPATDGEIGRIKGETLRLGGHEDAARNEFVIAYLRGDRDPQLLGSLGLMARLRRDEPRARTYLEAVAAAPATIPRPRAYLEIARLRRAHYEASHPGRPLDAAELTQVLMPLLAGQKLPQQLSDTYLEIGAAWGNTSVVAKRTDLAVLEQGMSYFPQNGRIVLATAALFIRHGFKSEASSLITRTLEATSDPEMKTHLDRLLRHLRDDS
jgi:hypothetical protein